MKVKPHAARFAVALLFACVPLCDRLLVRVWKLWGFPWPGVKNFPGMYTAGPPQTRSRAKGMGRGGWRGESVVFVLGWGSAGGG